MAQAIKRHIFGPNFTLQEAMKDKVTMNRYLTFLRDFEDKQGAKLSIHNLCTTGTLTPGKWIGPTAVCFAFRYIFEAYPGCYGGLKLHVCREGNIFFTEIEELFRESNSVLVLVPMQLGYSKTMNNQNYATQLHHIFKFS